MNHQRQSNGGGSEKSEFNQTASSSSLSTQHLISRAHRKLPERPRALPHNSDTIAALFLVVGLLALPLSLFVEGFASTPYLVFKSSDFLSHREWIDAGQLAFQLQLFFFSQVPAVNEALGRGATLLLMAADLAASFPPFALLFHRHAEQVAPLTPEFEQSVEIFKKLAVLKPLVAGELPNVGVVVLLHVDLVVLEVGARAGLVDTVLFSEW